MKFIVDAQLPKQMTTWISRFGGDAIHTLDLPTGNRTTEIIRRFGEYSFIELGRSGMINRG